MYKDDRGGCKIAVDTVNVTFSKLSCGGFFWQDFTTFKKKTIFNLNIAAGKTCRGAATFGFNFMTDQCHAIM